MGENNTHTFDGVGIWGGGFTGGLVGGIAMGVVLHFGAGQIELLATRRSRRLAPITSPGSSKPLYSRVGKRE